MKKTILMMLFFTLSLMGCKSMEEQHAEDMIKKYYQALIDEDYEKAFEQLHPYDDHYIDGTAMSKEEARALYLKKMNFLKKQGYKLKGYEITGIEYEDGHSFWHHIKLEVEQSGQVLERVEVAIIFEGKVVLGSSDDPYVKYRDGQMKIEINK
jgi:hypothetical protein